VTIVGLNALRECSPGQFTALNIKKIKTLQYAKCRNALQPCNIYISKHYISKQDF